MNRTGKFELSLRMRFALHALLLATTFGWLGWFIIGYGFIGPIGISQGASDIHIEATGLKSKNSNNAEVWFYGAFRISDGGKISWSNFQVDASWERRGDVYVSYKNQPNSLSINYSEPLRLEFGAHPYSGLVNIRSNEGNKKVNLYANSTTSRSVIVNNVKKFHDPKYYIPIIALFSFIGVGLAAAFVFFRLIKIYHWISIGFLSISLYITVVLYFPGVYTNDSADQLRQALVGQYHDWHPPLMAWFWSILIKVTGRIESLFIFHLLLLAFGAIYWMKLFERLQLQSFQLVISLFLISPVVINFSGVIWKDVGFAYSLFLCSGILGLSFIECRISSGRIAVVLFLMIYAMGVRANGIFAIIPFGIIFCLLIIYKYEFNNSLIRSVGLSTLAAILLISAIGVGLHSFSNVILKVENRYPIQYLKLYDIAGISKHAASDYFPSYIKTSSHHNIDVISKRYIEATSVLGNANSLLFIQQNGSPSLIPLNKEPELQRELHNAWVSAIIEEPMAYVKHRFSVFSFLMGKESYSSEIPQTDVNRAAVLQNFAIDAEAVSLSPVFSWGRVGAMEFFHENISFANGSFLYIGWTWLAILTAQLLIGLLIIRRFPAGAIVVAVSASGLFYILPYLVVAPASDFRYLYWGVVSAGILAIFIIAASLSAAVKYLLKRAYCL